MKHEVLTDFEKVSAFMAFAVMLIVVLFGK